MEDILTTINLETYSCKVGNIRRGVIFAMYIRDLLMERKFKSPRNIAELYYAYCQHQLTVYINYQDPVNMSNFEICAILTTKK